MKRKRIKKGLVITLISLILVFAIILVLLIINNNKAKNKTKVLDEIKEYNYILENNETDLYKKLFKELSKTLKEKSINYEEYGSLVSKLFVADFYNLDNKVTKNDVGGTQFVLSDKQDNFLLKSKDTIYKNIESNVYNNRKQELPIVTDVKVNSIDETTYEYDENNYDGYIVKLNFKYKKDLGYETEKEIILIKNDKKLEIVDIK